MAQHQRITKLAYLIFLMVCMLFMARCGEGPSPFSPVSDTESQSTQKIRPVKRKATSDAKIETNLDDHSGYYDTPVTFNDDDEKDDNGEKHDADEANDCRGTIRKKFMTVKKGGKLKHCGHKMKITKKALSKDMMMYIRISDDEYITADFGPSQQFNKEVEVTISYKNADLDGIDEDSLTLAWYDEVKGEWIEIEGDVKVNKKKKTVKGKTDHFTQYTLSSK